MRLRVAVPALLVFSVIGLAQQPPRPIMNGGLPSVSPRGDAIAFVSNRDGKQDVYLITPDGASTVRITDDPARESAPFWTLDARVVYTVWADSATTVFAASGRKPQPAVLTKLAARGVSVAPDGKSILYGRGQFPAMQIVAAALDGSGAHDLTKTPSAVLNPAYSPDQKTIAFARMDSTRQLQIWVMNADGSGERQLTHFTADEGSPQWPAWSPDGSRLAIQSGKYDRQNPSANSAHIWIIDVKSGAATRLNPHGAYLDETPSWFPDGKRIAFQSDRGGRMEVWVMNADGTGAVQITK